MKLTIDTEAHTLTCDARTIDLYSDEAFVLLSRQWLTVGWNQKYTYTFTWLGRPIIQLPEDMVRLQEVIYRVKPDVIIETGIAHGGSLVFSASLCRLNAKGRVIGIDVEIRPHNRRAIEAHELSPLITLVDGNSVDPTVVADVKALVREGESVLAILDSKHTKAHVAAELEAYHGLVTSGSYIVATDGIMQWLAGARRGAVIWREDNPAAAAREFALSHPEFVLEQPPWPFNESTLVQNVSHWPDAWLRKS